MTEPAAPPRLTETFLTCHEVQRIQDAYAEYLDGGEYERWLDLFTADPTLTIGQKVHRGREGLKSFLDTRGPHPARRHLTGPAILVTATADHCSAEANFLVLEFTEAGLAATATGRYHDELRMDGGRWRIAARTVRIGARP